MKNLLLGALAISLITTYFVLNTCKAQAPQGIPYQAIARNGSGLAIANTAVKVRFSIRDSIATGPVRYQETHNTTTSALGLFSVNVGMGTVLSGTFSGINWGKNAKFLQVELDPAGGTAYTDLGTTQMMSVPYALYSGNINGLPVGGAVGQVLTTCEDGPVWTNNGICPGRINILNCAAAVQSAHAYATFPVTITMRVPYLGGNGGFFYSMPIESTGVTGLIATINSGVLNNGNGSLIVRLSGIAAASGIANFALNFCGKLCNLQLNILPVPSLPTDADGNIYDTIKIGQQTWMKQNLKASRYLNGDSIENNLDNNQWSTNITGAFSVYNNDQANNATYGKLYNWYASTDPRRLCPAGWHVPTDHDWNTLVNFVEPSADTSCLGCLNTAGGFLKSSGIFESGTGLWNSPNAGATNATGFSGLPGGYRDDTGNYLYLNYYGAWWSSTQLDNSLAWLRNMVHYIAYVNRPKFDKNYGFSVRCIKD